jgi:hypothetical protein
LGKEAVLRNATKLTPPDENGFAAPENAAVSKPDLTYSEGRARGKTISFDKSRGFDAKGEDMDVPRDECEENPIEWIMITRSDPGGSVPRFMVERGTPGGIVSDARKFLNWACAKTIEDFDDDDELATGGGQYEKAQDHKHRHDHEHDLHNYQTNGHLAGLEVGHLVNGSSDTGTEEAPTVNGGGAYGILAGAATAAGAMFAANAPHFITDHLLGHAENGSAARRESVSTISTVSSVGSFASALEKNDSELNIDSSSIKTTESQTQSRDAALKDKELQKLEEKKQKLGEKLRLAREKEISKKSEDREKEEEAIRKAEEKHEKEVKKQEEKYKREVEKLEQKKLKEERKAEERKKKAAEKDEKTKMLRELEEMKAEVGVLRKEKQIMLEQVGALQAENTALAAMVGKMGLKEVKDEVGRAGRVRASSMKGIARLSSYRSFGSAEAFRDKDSQLLAVPSSGS